MTNGKTCNRLIAPVEIIVKLDMATDAQERGLEDERVRVLRDAIRRSFPVVAYEGKVTNCDGAWLPELNEENAIHDDDKFVYEALTGCTWPDIPKQFLREEPDGFVLLTDEALVAYLAAWLMCSLDEMDGENIVREFVIYSFSPSHDLQPDMTPEKVRRLRLLNLEQRSTVRLTAGGVCRASGRASFGNVQRALLN